MMTTTTTMEMMRCKMRSKLLSMAWVTNLLLMSAHVAVLISAQPGVEMQTTKPAKATGVGGSSEAFSHGIDTETTLYSFYNFLKCTSDQQVTPTTTEEVSDLIKLQYDASSRHSDQAVKIRATRRGHHSSAGFVCSGTRDSTKKEHNEFDNKEAPLHTSITVLLHRINGVVAVDDEKHMITVGAGMTLLELAVAAEENGMSVLAGVFPIYGNLTVGGVILASAHGTGLGTTSSLGDLVRKVKWVNGKGDIIVSDSATEVGALEVNALVGGLGLLGIVTEITLQLQPPSRTVVETRDNLDDTHIVSDLKRMLKEETPHIMVVWRPDFGTFRAIMYTQLADDRYGEDLGPSARPDFDPQGRAAGFDPVDDHTASAMDGLLAAWDADTADESAGADVLNAGVCEVGKLMNTNPMFLDGQGKPTSHANLRTNFAMITPRCTPKCPFDIKHMGTFGEDVEFTIKMSQLEEWVRDVKAIVETELLEVQDRLDRRYAGRASGDRVTRCLPPGNFWIRFGQGNQNLLSTSTGTEDVAYVQACSLHSARVPSKPAKHSSIVQTIEQLLLCKFKARPHWGKNHERMFRHPECHVRDNFPDSNFAQLLEMQSLHDPKKLFEPELFSRVLDRSGPDYSSLCTLHLWCYCREDAHCPDGHACEQSPVFPEYKICKLRKSVASGDESGHDEL